MSFVPNPAVMTQLKLGMARGLVGTQLILGKIVREQLSKPGTGRRYRRGRAGAAIPRGALRGTGRAGLLRKIEKARKRKFKNLRTAGVHVASAPGKPPAADTNRLRASWLISEQATTLQKGRKDSLLIEMKVPNQVGFIFGSRVKYAPWLEYGTARVKPRPYLRPAMAVVGKRMAKIFAVTLKEAFKNA
jgi:hypothetical protein